MPSRQVRDATFEYREAGTGEPVVLVHGSASDWRTWQSQLDAFGEHFRTIAYSRRYHWPNEPIPAGRDYAMQEHVDDLQALLPAFDAAPAHLVGHSYGGFVCLLLALREPRLVRSLVLAEPPVVTLFVSDPPTSSELLRLSVRRPRTALAIVKFGAKGIRPATAAARKGDMETAMRVFGKAVLGEEFLQRLPETRLEQIRANAIKEEFLGSGFAPIDDARLRTLDVPVLLITGKRSPALFHRIVDRLEELLPRTERTEISDASHIMHEDNAAAYNAAVLSFLSKQQPAAAERER